MLSSSRDLLSVVLCAVAVLIIAPSHADAFKMCGNYCGPSWCASDAISEADCVSKGVWGAPSDGSEIDECCKYHDRCCGESVNPERNECNSNITACANKAPSSLCQWTVYEFMKFLSGMCCGQACSSAVVAQLERSINRTITRDLVIQEAARPLSPLNNIAKRGLTCDECQRVVPALHELQLVGCSRSIETLPVIERACETIGIHHRHKRAEGCVLAVASHCSLFHRASSLQVSKQPSLTLAVCQAANFC